MFKRFRWLAVIALLMLVARPGFSSLKMMDVMPAIQGEGQQMLERLAKLAGADLSELGAAPTRDELRTELDKAFALTRGMAQKSVDADRMIAREAPFRALHNGDHDFARSGSTFGVDDADLYETDYVSPVSPKMFEAVNILKAGL